MSYAYFHIPVLSEILGSLAWKPRGKRGWQRNPRHGWECPANEILKVQAGIPGQSEFLAVRATRSPNVANLLAYNFSREPLPTLQAWPRMYCPSPQPDDSQETILSVIRREEG